MIKSIYTTAKSKLMLSLPTNFLRNNEGIAAIEFAFIAPVMLFMYFGMAEIASAITVDRQVSHSTNVAADLTTQTETVSSAEIEDIMAATVLVMNVPTATEDGAPRNKLIIEIASYSRDTSGNIVNMGTATLNGAFPESLDTDDLEERILSNTSGIVVARVSYNYEPLKLAYLPDDFEIKETFMLKPRKSINVTIEDTACTLINEVLSC